MKNTYAAKAITALLEGKTITINEFTYCYLQKGVPCVIAGFEFESSIPQLYLVYGRFKSETEYEPHLLGADHLTLSNFLAFCSAKSFDDVILDFSIKIPAKNGS